MSPLQTPIFLAQSSYVNGRAFEWDGRENTQSSLALLPCVILELMQLCFSVFPDTKTFSILLSSIFREFQASSPTFFQGMNFLNMSNKCSYSLGWNTSSPFGFWIDLIVRKFFLLLSWTWPLSNIHQEVFWSHSD